MEMIKRLLLFCLMLGLTAAAVPWNAGARAAGEHAEAMTIDAGAAILFDVEQNLVLFEQDADARMYPASLVKLMTALLAVEAVEAGTLSLARQVTVSTSSREGFVAADITLGMRAGDTVTVEELLYCATVGSANEACTVLAELVSGDVASFVAQMNARAAQLGCKDTNFTNPHGLHDERQYTTAYDAMLLTREALRHELLRELCRADEFTVSSEAYSGQRFFYSSNYLLSGKKVPGYIYRYAIGMRTGYTPEAGSCLAAAAVKKERTLISIVLNARNGTQPDGSYKLKSFSESIRLLEWGFNNFSMQTLIRASTPLGEVPVTLSRDADYVVVHPAEELQVMLPNGTDVSAFERKLTLYAESVQAPVEKGQALGRLIISHEGKEYGSVELIALNDVERSELLYKVQFLHEFFLRPEVRRAATALLILIAAGFALAIARGGRKRAQDGRGRYLRYQRKPRGRRR